MRDALYDPIYELHNSPLMLSAITTGAGAGLQSLLWNVAGSSRTILSFHLPYATEALSSMLGFTPFKFVAKQTAVAMAKRALDDALLCRKSKDVPVIGLGVTASVSTDRDRRGRDEAWLAIATPTKTMVQAVDFDKTITRANEGEMVDLVALNLILAEAGIQQVPLPASPGTFRISAVMDATPAAALDLYEKPLFMPHGRCTVDELKPDQHIIYPGSFNPLHQGHKGMADMAERMTGKTVVFNITNAHPDKGNLSDTELLRRGNQFFDYRPILFSRNDALFFQKARQFPGFSFLIGADTAQAILNPTYYGPDDAIGRDHLLKVLDEFAGLGTTFYVAGRVVDGTFIDPTKLNAPVVRHGRDDFSYGGLFKPIGGRWDVRSRDLR